MAARLSRWPDQGICCKALRLEVVITSYLLRQRASRRPLHPPFRLIPPEWAPIGSTTGAGFISSGWRLIIRSHVDRLALALFCMLLFVLCAGIPNIPQRLCVRRDGYRPLSFLLSLLISFFSFFLSGAIVGISSPALCIQSTPYLLLSEAGCGAEFSPGYRQAYRDVSPPTAYSPFSIPSCPCFFPIIEPRCILAQVANIMQLIIYHGRLLSMTQNGPAARNLNHLSSSILGTPFPSAARLLLQSAKEGGRWAVGNVLTTRDPACNRRKTESLASDASFRVVQVGSFVFSSSSEACAEVHPM
ncbi:hypothetical protein F5Y05DRAFT_221401 [Hypoxylon sp. FL0543]|nr:hypothetical protein F5Y05DRAFT_221401 [Hypoxylon sp. FL0543]